MKHCSVCGAAVVSEGTHTVWHRRMSALASSDMMAVLMAPELFAVPEYEDLDLELRPMGDDAL